LIEDSIRRGINKSAFRTPQSALTLVCPHSAGRPIADAKQHRPGDQQGFPHGRIESRATMRIEIINLFNQPRYAALASTSVGNTQFGLVTTQGNYSRLAPITLRMSF
jgi:hypothetical protein